MKSTFQPSPFARSLVRQMIIRRARAECGQGNARTSPLWPTWTDGLHPDFRAQAAEIVRQDAIRLHPMVHALHSSMAFALNLFLPFRLGDPKPLGALLSEKLGRLVKVDRVIFEYAGPTGVLAEVAREHATEREKFTAADVAVFVRDAADRKGLVLLEVKLSESGFTTCGGAESPRNRNREPCDSAAHLFANPAACYLRRPAHASRDRRYWPIFEKAHGSLRAAFPGCGDTGGCPFRGDAQQPMRNHALLLGLEQAGVVDFGSFGLVHHDGNPDVVPPWDRYAALIEDRARLFRMPASEVAAAAGPEIRTWITERYVLAGA